MGLAYLILFISLIPSVAICVRVKYNTMVRDGQRLKDIVALAKEDTQKHFAKVRGVMEGVRGLFLASDDVRPQDWNIFLDSLQFGKESLGIQDLGFAVYVKNEQIAEHQAKMAKNRADYKVFPLGQRVEYCPVVFLRDGELGEVNTLGWDALSEANRREALERARDSGRSACTKRVTMYHPNFEKALEGHVVYLPVYRGAVLPTTVEERRTKLAGFVFASFLQEDLWKRMLRNKTTKMLDVEIFENGKLVYDSYPELAPGVKRKGLAISREGELKMSGQQWTARITTLEAFDRESMQYVFWWVLLVCALISGTLFMLGRKLALRRILAEQMMQNLRKSEKALSESEARFRQVADDACRSEERLARIVETIADGVIILDGDGEMASRNPAAEEILGLAASNVSELRALIGRLRVNSRRSFIYDYRRSDGVEIVLSINAAPFSVGQGAATGVVASIRDVSLEKENEQSLLESQTRMRILNNILGLMAAGSEVTQIVVRTVNELARFFPDYRIVFSQAREHGWEAVCSEGALASVKGATFSFEEEPELKGEFFGAKPLVVSDLATDDRFNKLRECPYFKGARSILEQPLRNGPGLAGLLSFHSPDAREWTAAEKVMLQEIADYIAAAYTQLEVAEQRRQAETALQAEKERLAVTLRSIADGVITTDIDGRVVLMNRAAELLTGWTQADAMGRLITEVFEIVDEKTREKLPNPAMRVVEDGSISAAGYDAILLGRNGGERIVTESAAAIRDQKTNVIGAALVFRDVTEKRRFEREFQKASKLESVGVLAGGIAHDFNNILSVILGNITLCKMMSPAGSTVHDRLGQAEKGSLRARELTQQLLTFAKGGAPIRKSASIVEIVNESVAFAAHGSNVECRNEATPDLWPAEVDEGQISQVFNNLVINAVQAMPEGGKLHTRMENCHIFPGNSLSLAPGRYVRISVQDTGAGISREHLPRIFDPYFSTKTSGSGLGLATTYAIVQKHQGCITVESGVGEGTTFHIYLPASDSPAPRRVTTPEPTIPHGGGRVLVMDDETAILDLAKESLRRFGYNVDTAVHGGEAIEKFQLAHDGGAPYAAVIMDLTVPGGIGGKEAMKRLLEIDPKVKAIVSSGYSHDPVMANFRQFGFAGVVEKPYQVEVLAKTLGAIIQSRN